MPTLGDKEREILSSFASRVDRNDPGALNNLGVLFVRKAMYEEAIVQFKRALAIDSKFDLARDNLWYVYRVSNIEDPDVREWAEQVSREPDNKEHQLRLGISYCDIGRLDEAEEILGRLVESDPDRHAARTALGNTLMRKGRYREALEHYLHVSEQKIDDPAYHTDLGEIYYNLGRNQEAISALLTAIDIDGAYWKPHFLLSFAYGDEGRLEDALKESTVAARLNPSFGNSEANLSLTETENKYRKTPGANISEEIVTQDSTSFLLGTAYKERGYLKEALVEFELALLETPDDDVLHMEIAKLHLADGRTEKAVTHLLKTLEYNPANAQTFKILGCEHHLRGKLFEASTCYLEAYRLNSADPDVMNNLGVVLYQTGLREDAERMFKKGLNRDMYHVPLNANVLTSFILREDFQMAQNFFRHLENFANNSPVFYEKRALLNFKMDKLTAALDDAKKAVAMDADRSDGLFLEALVRLREDKVDDAVQAVIEGSKISKRFTGLDLLLACDYGKSCARTVASVVDFEPDDDMINLLQASTNQGFDRVRDTLAEAVEKTLRATEDGYADGDAGTDEAGENPSGIISRESEAGDELQAAEWDDEPGELDADSKVTGFETLNKLIEDLKN